MRSYKIYYPPIIATEAPKYPKVTSKSPTTTKKASESPK